MRLQLLKYLAPLAIVAAAIPVAAMDVQPTVNVINLPRDAGGIRVAVRNPRTVPIPVTFEIVERKVNADGTEVHSPADHLFAVYPAQAAIAPGKTQAVRVQWVGGALSKSSSFTLFATEVPVDLTASSQSGVQRILKIGASVHVVPDKTEPRPTIQSAETVSGGVKVAIHNDGNRFIYIDNLALQFAGKTIAGIELANMAGRTLIPPGSTREFVVPGVKGQPTLKLVGPLL